MRIVLTAVLAFVSCASASLAPTGPFSKEVTVAQGKTVSVVDDVSLHFVAVAGDSRCPKDVVCIQGGDAIVKLQVKTSGDTRDAELHTANTQPVVSGDLTLELLQLMPYPFSGRTIQPEEYRATLKVSR
jgi:hypothetical protein